MNIFRKFKVTEISKKQTGGDGDRLRMKNSSFAETPKSDHLHRLCASSKRRASASSPLLLSNRTTRTLWALTLSPAPADALIPHCLKGAEADTGRSWGRGTTGRWEREVCGAFAWRKLAAPDALSHLSGTIFTHGVVVAPTESAVCGCAGALSIYLAWLYWMWLLFFFFFFFTRNRLEHRGVEIYKGIQWRMCSCRCVEQEKKRTGD